MVERCICHIYQWVVVILTLQLVVSDMTVCDVLSKYFFSSFSCLVNGLFQCIFYISLVWFSLKFLWFSFPWHKSYSLRSFLKLSLVQIVNLELDPEDKLTYPSICTFLIGLSWLYNKKRFYFILYYKTVAPI